MEFGSDFHLCASSEKGGGLTLPEDAGLYFSGRQALEALVLSQGYKRMWVPAYYCYESLKRLHQLPIEIKFYDCTPLTNPREAISGLSYRKGDLLMRMNYFGLWGFYDSGNIGVDVIEDHSHDLFGPWARKSNAEWCFASLRKTLPIADGGIIWSPKHLCQDSQPSKCECNENAAEQRYLAMKMKADYLSDYSIAKDKFLELFHRTEEYFDSSPISAISDITVKILGDFDCRSWFEAKRRNFKYLFKVLKDYPDFRILVPENSKCSPFSLILLFDSQSKRDYVRKRLIETQVYPAILWKIPEGQSPDTVDFGNRMLSIHCDGRYSLKDMEELASKIIAAL